MRTRARTIRIRTHRLITPLVLIALFSTWATWISAQLPGSLIVAITSPGSGSTVGGTITVTANVSIVGVATTAGVRFRLDGVDIGPEDQSAPYSIVWNTVPASNGSHTLTAIARDVIGLTYASDPVTVTVFNDKTPPSVSVTFPTAGSTVSGSVTVTANASDNVAVSGVQFFVDGAAFGPEDLAAPYAIDWDTTAATNSSHTLTARARDAAGNAATSAAVTVSVFNDSSAPTVSITSPANAQTLTGIVTVNADATDNVGVVGVQFFADGSPLGTEDLTTPYSASWDTSALADNSQHTLTARARDAAGNSSTSAAITVTVAVSHTPTRLEETSPAVVFLGSWSQGNTARAWSGGTAAIAAAAGARATLGFGGSAVSWIGFKGPQIGIANVYLDGTLVATVDGYAAAEEVGAVLFNTSVASGSHTLAIEATATRNPSSSDSLVVVDAFDVTNYSDTSDRTPPTVSITAPGAGTTVSGMVAVTANAADNVGVVGVKILSDGMQVAPEDTSAPYVTAWDTSKTTDGSHTLTAVARDAAGNLTTAAGVPVSVSNAGAASIPTARRVENPDPNIIYTPGTDAPSRPPDWWHGSRSRGWSDGTASVNRSAGARATFTFTGTSIRWIGFRGPWAGIGDVYLDGSLVAEIDLYSVIEESQATVYSATNLSAGSHTIVVESTGRKNDSATDYAVFLDAFDVTPSSAPTINGTRVEEDAPAVTYTAGWTQGDTTRPWSGNHAAVSTTANASVSFTFTGTWVDWIGLSGPGTGIARVYLDGSFQAEIDTYQPAEVQGVIFRAGSLIPATHTLRIDVTGTKRAGATDSRIVVDAFDVRSRFEDTDSAVAFSTGWLLGETRQPFSGTSLLEGTGTAAVSATAGEQATFTFAGTSVAWIGFRGPSRGIARVFLDGTFATDVDTYAIANQPRGVVFSTSGLAQGTHVLRIEPTGQKNTASTGASIVVDAFDVTLPPVTPTISRVQETDPSIVYTAGWNLGNRSAFRSGENARLSTTTGAQATFTFNGTAVRWISQREFGAGIARVLLDGVAVATVDTFATLQEEYQIPLFTATGLTPGTHTLTIEVTGTKNPASGGVEVVVDAFDVY